MRAHPWLGGLLAALVLLLPARLLRAGEPPVDEALVEAVRGFLAEEDEGARAARGFAIAARWTDADAVARALAAAPTWKPDEPKDEVITWTRATADGVEHTILASIPPAYEPSRLWPVLIWLHGGVSRNEDGGGAYGIRYLGEASDAEGFLLLSPSSQAGAEWWTPNGVALVRGALGDLARRYRVDPDRVAVAGFSDGASGCFHLLAHDPEPYACFLPLMAHPGVTRLAGGPTFAANVRARPVFAVNGGKDTLYPSARIQPLMDELRAAGCDLTWTDLPEAGHRITDVLPDLWPRLREFWMKRWRQDPRHLAWETAVPEREGRFAAIEILTVDAAAPAAAGLEDGVLPDPAGRPRLGFRPDAAFPGPGLRVGEVEPGTAAAAAGLLPGDVIVSVDGEALTTPQAAFAVLRRALDAMTDRDGVFRVQRGDEVLEIRARPRVERADEGARPTALGYGRPAGRVVVKNHGDNRLWVETRHVGALRLYLSDQLVDFARPVQVRLNGKLVHDRVVAPSTAAVLEETRRDLPAGVSPYRAWILLRP